MLYLHVNMTICQIIECKSTQQSTDHQFCTSYTPYDVKGRLCILFVTMVSKDLFIFGCNPYNYQNIKKIVTIVTEI